MNDIKEMNNELGGLVISIDLDSKTYVWANCEVVQVLSGAYYYPLAERTNEYKLVIDGDIIEKSNCCDLPEEYLDLWINKHLIWYKNKEPVKLDEIFYLGITIQEFVTMRNNARIEWEQTQKIIRSQSDKTQEMTIEEINDLELKFQNSLVSRRETAQAKDRIKINIRGRGKSNVFEINPNAKKEGLGVYMANRFNDYLRTVSDHHRIFEGHNLGSYIQDQSVFNFQVTTAIINISDRLKLIEKTNIFEQKIMTNGDKRLVISRFWLLFITSVVLTLSLYLLLYFLGLNTSWFGLLGFISLNFNVGSFLYTYIKRKELNDKINMRGYSEVFSRTNTKVLQGINMKDSRFNIKTSN